MIEQLAAVKCWSDELIVLAITMPDGKARVRICVNEGEAITLHPNTARRFARELVSVLDRRYKGAK